MSIKHNPRLKFFTVITVTSLLTALPAAAFDLSQAIAFEGLFRGIAVRCGSDTFAADFVANSKAQVAMTLSDHNSQMPLEAVEALIDDYALHPDIEELDSATCEKVIIQLQQLHENRKLSLEMTQEVLRALAAPSQ